MRPSGWFVEFEERERSGGLVFEGKLAARFERVPKRQLIDVVAGGRPVLDYEFKREGCLVRGAVVFVAEEPKDDGPRIDKSRRFEHRVSRRFTQDEINDINYDLICGMSTKDVVAKYKIGHDLIKPITSGQLVGKDVVFV